MNYKQKLGYTVLGAVIMLVGFGVGSVVSPPLVAQNSGVFDEMTCSKLTVRDERADSYKQEAIVLESSPDGNTITIFDKWSKPREAIRLHGGMIESDISLHFDGKRAMKLESAYKMNAINMYSYAHPKQRVFSVAHMLGTTRMYGDNEAGNTIWSLP